MASRQAGSLSQLDEAGVAAAKRRQRTQLVTRTKVYDALHQNAVGV